jgi:hypothetical protein
MTGPAVFTASYPGDGNYNPSSTGAGTSVTVGPSVPGAPTDVTAIAGNGQATVSWTPPTDDGGSPVTSYTITATGPDGPVSSVWSASDTGSIGTVYPVTGLTNGDSYTFTVSATNSVGAGSASVASSGATPSSDDAVITSSDAGAFIPGRSFAIPLAATGPTVPTRSSTAWFSAVGLPSGVTLVPGTGKKADTATIDGSAQYAGGPFPILVTASNSSGTETSQIVTIYPVSWSSVPSDVTLVAGSQSAFSATESDPDAVLTHSTLPPGCDATVDNSEIVTDCLPTAGRKKPYRVTFTATDGKLKATATVEVTIDQAPAVTAAQSSVTVTAGRAVKISLSTTGYPAPTVTLTGAPSWLTATSKKLSGTTPAAGGSWTFTVNASNGVGTEASETITITATT